MIKGVLAVHLEEELVFVLLVEEKAFMAGSVADGEGPVSDYIVVLGWLFVEVELGCTA